MGVIWKRLSDTGKNWRHVYKVNNINVLLALFMLNFCSSDESIPCCLPLLSPLQALTVLEYMVGHGSERVIDEIRERAYQISVMTTRSTLFWKYSTSREPFFCYISVVDYLTQICPFSLLQTLSDFQYIDSGGRDQGSNVRKKSQSLVALVNDKERIAEVRQKAATNRDK